MNHFVNDFVDNFKLSWSISPIGMIWRTLILPLTATLWAIAWLSLGLGMFLAHGEWRSIR